MSVPSAALGPTRHRGIRTVHRSCHLLLCAWLMGCWGAVAEVRAAEKEALPPARSALVPANRPDLWPRGDWQAISPATYGELRRRAAPKPNGPAPVRLLQAEYRATFQGRDLVDGRVSVLVRRSSPEPALVFLEPCNLAVTRLIWDDGTEAVWGTTDNGRLALWMDRAEGTLTGEWSLRGRVGPDGVEFAVGLLPVAVQSLHLEIPSGQRLIGPDVSAEGPEPSERSGWSLWHISAGSRRRLTFRVARDLGPNSSQPRILVEDDVSCVVRERRLELQSDFRLQVEDAPVRRVTFLVPRELEVHTVEYAGENPLAAERLRSGSENDQLVVDLGEPFRGRTRLIRIRASISPKTSGFWRLPELRVEQASLIGGQLSLRVDPPLVLKAVDPAGYRQMGVDGETLLFQRTASDGRLLLFVGPTRRRMLATAYNDLQIGRSSSTAETRIAWSSRAGSVFAVDAQIQPGWEVTAVRVPGDDGSEQDTSHALNWTIHRVTDGQRILRIEFVDPLKTEAPTVTQIALRRRHPDGTATLVLPPITPLQCEELDLFVAVRVPSSVAAELNAGSFRILEPDETSSLPPLIRSWREQALATRAESDATQWVLETRDRTATGSVKLSAATSPAEVEARVTVRVLQDRLWEQFELDCRGWPQHPHAALAVLVTGEVDSLPWRRLAENGQWVDVEAIESPRESTDEAWRAHRVWRLPLPSEKRHVRFRAVRTRALQPEGEMSLLFVPHASSFRGTVRIEDASETTEWQMDGLSPAEPAAVAASDESKPAASGEVRIWSYSDRSASARWSLKTNEPSGTGDASPLMATLDSRLFVDGHSDALHVATWRPVRGNLDSFRFRLRPPSHVVSVRVNGRVTQPVSEGEWFVVQPPDGETVRLVSVRYRSRLEHRRPSGAWEVAVPEVPWPVDFAKWRFAMPPDYQPRAEPPGMALTRPLPSPSWQVRLFGPLGRMAGDRIFNPLAPSSWFSNLRSDRVQSTNWPDSNTSLHQLPIPNGWNVWEAYGTHNEPDLLVAISHVTWWRRTAWLVFFGTLLMGLIVRTRHGRGLTRIHLSWTALLLVAALLAPRSWAEVVGGLLAGTLLATLVPIPQFRRRSASPDRPVLSDEPPSTRTYRYQPVGLVLLALSLVPWTRLDAQSSSSRNADDERPVILIPHDSSSPDQDPPVIYVDRPYLERLEELARRHEAAPRYLIMSAEYEGGLARDRANLKVRYVIAVLPTASPTNEPVRVRLPIRGAPLGGPVPCLLDGQPYALVRSPGNDAFEIDLPVAAVGSSSTPSENTATTIDSRDAEPSVETGRRSANSAGEGHPSAAFHTLELQLLPHVQPIGDGGRFELQVPPVMASRLVLPRVPEPSNVLVDGARGTVTAGDATEENDPQWASYRADVGLTERFAVSWASGNDAIEPVSSLKGRLACLAEVEPLLTRWYCRAECEVVEGRVNALVLRLPRGAVFRKLHTEVPLATQSVIQREGVTRISLLFAEPQSRPFHVDVELVRPNSEPGVIQIPRFALLDEQASDVEVESGEIQIGLRAPAGFHLEEPASLGAQVARIAPSAFPEIGMPSGPPKPPDLAYRLAEASPFRMRLVSDSVRRRVQQRSESVRVEPDVIVWELAADISLEDGPAWQHTLTVDPRLRIEEVTVEENGVSQLRRWTRVGDRLILWLHEAAFGKQSLRVLGTMPIQRRRPVTLPSARVEAAVMEPGELTIRCRQDVDVMLVGQAASDAAPEDTGAASESDENYRLVRRLTLTDDQRPEISVRLVRAEPTIHEILLLKHIEGRRWETELVLLAASERPQPQRLLLRIPMVLVQAQRAAGPDVTVRFTKKGDTLTAAARVGPARRDNVLLTARGMLTAPETGAWEIPSVGLPPRVKRVRWLVVGPAAPVELMEAREDLSRSWDDLPHAAREMLSRRGVPHDAIVYRQQTQPWRLEIRKSQPAEDVDIALMATRIRLTREGEMIGSTLAIVNPGRTQLRWHVPDSFRLQTVFVDGYVVAPPPVEDRRFTIALNDESRPHVVLFEWHQSLPELRWWHARTALEIPQPSGMQVARSHGVIVSATTWQTLWSLQFDRASPPRILAVMRELAETIAPIARVDAKAALPVVASLREDALSLQAMMRGSRDGDATWQSQLDSMLARIEELEKAQAGDRFDAAGLDTPAVFPLAGFPNRCVLLADFPPQQTFQPIVVWRLDVRWLLALVAVLIVAASFRWIIPRLAGWYESWREKRVARPTWTVALLGLLWWLCLRPSLVGPLLILGAVFVELERRRTNTLIARQQPPTAA